ncbi:MAG: helix-turn-helix domain-containing protein [Bryobacteraceae bacterium]
MFTQEFLNELASEIAKRIPMPMAAEPLAFTVAEAAKLLNLSETTVREMIREREIAVVRRGARVLITKPDMLDWLNRNRT